MAKAARGEHVEFAFIPVTAVKYTYTVIPALVMTVPVVYRALGGSHYPGGDEKLSEADADRADRRPAGDPADWPAGHLDRQRYFRAGVYDPQLSRLAVGGDHGRAVAAVGDDRYAPRLYADHHSDHRRNRQRGYGDAVGDRRQPVARRLFAGGSVENQNPELRQTALAAAASAILAGISEPALYGVAVRLKRPLIASLISGFICGAVAGIAGLASHSMAAPGLFTSVQFFDPANPMTIVWVFGVMALSVVLSFALTLILALRTFPLSRPLPTPERAGPGRASHA